MSCHLLLPLWTRLNHLCCVCFQALVLSWTCPYIFTYRHDRGLVIFGTIVCLSGWKPPVVMKDYFVDLVESLIEYFFFYAGITAWRMHSVFGLLLQLCICVGWKEKKRKLPRETENILVCTLLAITRLLLLNSHRGFISFQIKSQMYLGSGMRE